MVEVLVAIQEPMVRMGIRASLERDDATRVAGVLEDVGSLRRVLEANPQAVLILDVRYRRADPELIGWIVRDFPDVRVLVYVAHTAAECVVLNLFGSGGRARLSPEAMARVDECCLTSLRQQAHGCLPTEVDAGDVVRAVKAAAAGEIVAAPWLMAANDFRAGLEGEGALRPVTARELDVMALVAQGIGNKAIARRLGIREQTVKNHVARLMEKLGVANRVQVGLLASGCALTVEAQDEE